MGLNFVHRCLNMSGHSVASIIFASAILQFLKGLLSPMKHQQSTDCKKCRTTVSLLSSRQNTINFAYIYWLREVLYGVSCISGEGEFVLILTI
jgi:hypothetical protein